MTAGSNTQQPLITQTWQCSNAAIKNWREAVITASITILVVTVCLLPVYLDYSPYFFSLLMIAALLSSVIALAIPLWAILTGVGRNRINYIVTSFLPLAINLGLGMLAVLLLVSRLRLAPIYTYFHSVFHTIDADGIERMIANTLLTLTHLNPLWHLLAQFGAAILGWSLWFANFVILYDFAHQVYRYDGAVTLAPHKIRSFAISFIAAFALIGMVLLFS